MSTRVRLHPDAETELREAARWYEHRHAGLGLRLLDAVDDDTIQVLAISHDRRRPNYWRDPARPSSPSPPT